MPCHESAPPSEGRVIASFIIGQLDRQHLETRQIRGLSPFMGVECLQNPNRWHDTEIYLPQLSPPRER